MYFSRRARYLRNISCDEGEEGSATGGTLTCETTVEPSDCPPGTVDTGRPVCVYPPNEQGVCEFGDNQGMSGNCQIDRPSEPQCWGVETNSAGQCVIDSRSITCDEGEEGSPNEGNTGLICTSPGEPGT